MSSAAEAELYGAIGQLRIAYTGVAPAPADVAVEKLVVADPPPEPTYEAVTAYRLMDPQPEGADAPLYEAVQAQKLVEPTPVYETVYEPGVDPALARLDAALLDFHEHMKTR